MIEDIVVITIQDLDDTGPRADFAFPDDMDVDNPTSVEIVGMGVFSFLCDKLEGEIIDTTLEGETDEG